MVSTTGYRKTSPNWTKFQFPWHLGDIIAVDDEISVVESVKAASDLFSPVSGEIIEVNNELQNSPQLLNTDPENTGWYMKIKIDNTEELTNLMNFNQYKETF